MLYLTLATPPVGYRTFIGYMYMEVTNNHPVVRAFLALLQETTPSQRTSLRVPPDNSTSDLTSSGSPGRDTNGLHHRHTAKGGEWRIKIIYLL